MSDTTEVTPTEARGLWITGAGDPDPSWLSDVVVEHGEYKDDVSITIRSIHGEHRGRLWMSDATAKRIANELLLAATPEWTL